MKTKSYVVVAGVCVVVAGLALAGAVTDYFRGNDVANDDSGNNAVVENENGEKEYVYNYTADSVESLDIDITHGDVEFVSGSEFEIMVSNADTCEVNSSLSDNSTMKFEVVGKGLLSAVESPKIVITLPEGFVAKKADIELAAGEMRLDNLSADIFDIEIGAGNCVINNVDVTDKFGACVGAGKLSVGNGNIVNLDFECGAGKAEILNGTVTGNMDIECGMGAVELNVNMNKDNYYFDVECGLGSVVLGEDSFNGITEKTLGDKNAPYRADIECGIGKVSVIIPKSLT